MFKNKFKSLAFFSLLTMAVSANAGWSGVGSYEQSTVNTTPDARVLKLGVQNTTKLGTFDVQAVHLRGAGTATGVEAGYGNFVNVGPVRVDGRAAFGRVDSQNQVTLSAVGTLPLYKGLGVYGGGKYVGGVLGSTGRSNQLSVGLSAQLRQNLSGSFGVNRNFTAANTRNGLGATVAYQF